MQNHACIRHLVQELTKCYFQSSVGDIWCLLFLNQAWQIVCTVYRKYANLFLCMPKNPKAFMLAFFPIAYLWFSLFFTTRHNNCFALWNVFHVRDKKNPLCYLAFNYAWEVFYWEVDVGLYEHVRCSSLRQS